MGTSGGGAAPADTRSPPQVSVRAPGAAAPPSGRRSSGGTGPRSTAASCRRWSACSSARTTPTPLCARSWRGASTSARRVCRWAPAGARSPLALWGAQLLLRRGGDEERERQRPGAPRFEAKPCHFPAVWPWAGYLTSLVPPCKMKIAWVYFLGFL